MVNASALCVICGEVPSIKRPALGPVQRLHVGAPLVAVKPSGNALMVNRARATPLHTYFRNRTPLT